MTVYNYSTQYCMSCAATCSNTAMPSNNKQQDFKLRDLFRRDLKTFFISFCLRAPRYGLTLWFALGLLAGTQYKLLSYSYNERWTFHGALGRCYWHMSNSTDINQIRRQSRALYESTGGTICHVLCVTTASYSTRKAWNRLPTKLKTSTCSTDSFKRSLKTLLFQSAYGCETRVSWLL